MIVSPIYDASVSSNGRTPVFEAVNGSSTLPTEIYGQVSIAAIAADCKSATHAVNTVGSIPTLPTIRSHKPNLVRQLFAKQ